MSQALPPEERSEFRGNGFVVFSPVEARGQTPPCVGEF